ncbi:hypothetical protein SCP_0604900 [Sparassis crispa]|uniref:Uncharacterized protein n=1 Tax=Sparassis crispa TaxID=139825 RepID=A0A401GQJ2_9APHY|nr:hypothetical protein SCP_0604900 [Sparassis crispa]GBE84511.1 hypothetical protein SCP_0604900 [Sparassis crispa]
MPPHQERGPFSSSSSCDAWPGPTTTPPPPSHFHCPARWNARHALQEGMQGDMNDAPASRVGAVFIVVVMRCTAWTHHHLSPSLALPLPCAVECAPYPARGHGGGHRRHPCGGPFSLLLSCDPWHDPPPPLCLPCPSTALHGGMRAMPRKRAWRRTPTMPPLQSRGLCSSSRTLNVGPPDNIPHSSPPPSGDECKQPGTRTCWVT